ncbi:MAG: hypothetical protein JWP29_1744 [Rhodoferax sp.]|nr:hypothetical protein [Rhodoferax sp.]
MQNPPPNRLELAVTQLRVAIALFLELREYREVITLAQTAEDILEDLAREAAANRAGTRRNGSHQRLGAEPEKAFARFGAESRVTSGDPARAPWSVPIEFGLEAEAITLINRAVAKYRLLHARAASFILVYERRRDVLMRSARGMQRSPG